MAEKQEGLSEEDLAKLYAPSRHAAPDAGGDDAVRKRVHDQLIGAGRSEQAAADGAEEAVKHAHVYRHSISRGTMQGP